jgi:hypothetical protein
LPSSAQRRNELLLIILLKILCGAAAEDGTALVGDGLMSPLTSIGTSVAIVMAGSSVSETPSIRVNEEMSIPPARREMQRFFLFLQANGQKKSAYFAHIRAAEPRIFRPGLCAYSPPEKSA